MTLEGTTVNTKNRSRILVVEDDEGHARLIRKAFSAYTDEFKLQLLRTLGEAREYLSLHQPDMVITDIVLPDGRGTELLTAEGAVFRFPLVVMSSHGDEQVAVDALKSGAMDYIVKPDNNFREMPLTARRVLREWEHVLQKRRDDLLRTTLYKISQAANSDINIEDFYRSIHRNIGLLIDAANFFIALYDPNTEMISLPYFIDEYDRNMKTYKFGRGLTEQVLLSGEPLLINNKRCQELVKEGKVEIVGTPCRCWLGVPLKFGKRTFGALVVQHYRDTDAYTDRDKEMLMFVSDQIAAVIARKQAENEKQELEKRVINLEKMEAIGHLAAGVAHDLNNVLSAIVSYPDLLLMKISKDSPLRKQILTIQQSGQKAAAIVQDMLTLARRGVAVNEVVNLKDVLTNYLLSPEYEKLRKYHPAVAVKTDFDDDLSNIEGSYFHLSKAVMNLVSNAAEAMSQGGIITISLKNAYVDKPLQGYDLGIQPGEYVALTVSDTGMGMTPEDMNKIFEPFYTKKEMGRSGTGLGMTVVWGTVKDHYGYIKVESTEDKGTVFDIYFPVTYKKIARRKPDLPIESYIGNGEIILFVDDDKQQREIATALLSTLGYAVHTVGSGEEAVDYMTNNPAPDLVVLDMIMDPGIDGLDTYKALLQLNPHQKALIASGFSETERVKEAQRLGAGDYIKKPYTLEKIGFAVKTELTKKPER